MNFIFPHYSDRTMSSVVRCCKPLNPLLRAGELRPV